MNELMKEGANVNSYLFSEISKLLSNWIRLQIVLDMTNYFRLQENCDWIFSYVISIIAHLFL